MGFSSIVAAIMFHKELIYFKKGLSISLLTLSVLGVNYMTFLHFHSSRLNLHVSWLVRSDAFVFIFLPNKQTKSGEEN